MYEFKEKLETKMQSLHKHLIQGTASQLGYCPAALWSAFEMSNNDRTPEIKIGVRETKV